MCVCVCARVCLCLCMRLCVQMEAANGANKGSKWRLESSKLQSQIYFSQNGKGVYKIGWGVRLSRHICTYVYVQLYMHTCVCVCIVLKKIYPLLWALVSLYKWTNNLDSKPKQQMVSSSETQKILSMRIPQFLLLANHQDMEPALLLWPRPHLKLYIAQSAKTVWGQWEKLLIFHS